MLTFFRVKIGVQELIAGHHGGVAVPGAVLVAEKENAKWACIFEMVDGRESIRRTTIQRLTHIGRDDLAGTATDNTCQN